MNFAMTVFEIQNTTVAGFAPEFLMCPSDTGNTPMIVSGGGYSFDARNGAIRQAYSSYAGSAGTYWDGWTAPNNWDGALVNTWTPRLFKERDILDGQSNTIAYGERAHSVLPLAERDYWHWWNSGWDGDTQFSSRFPINAFKKTFPDATLQYYGAIEGSSSMHPGGAQYSFVDGSVRFISDNIESWQLRTGSDAFGILNLQRGIWQALTTRAGKEAVPDTY
jgi:prepilin-type processing-associated H-X9-DG protein